jgi:hypothetical protein
MNATGNSKLEEYFLYIAGKSLLKHTNNSFGNIGLANKRIKVKIMSQWPYFRNVNVRQIKTPPA